MTTPEKIILGIDPGTNVLGYGVLRIKGNKATMEAMGVIDLRKCKDVYLKLGRIHERVIGIIDAFKPDEMAIEAPFFGKNVQSMLKLGRAEGRIETASNMKADGMSIELIQKYSGLSPEEIAKL